MGKDLKGKELGEGFRQNKSGRYEYRYITGYGVRKSLYDSSLEKLKEAATIAKSSTLTGRDLREEGTTLSCWFKSWLEYEKTEVTRAVTRQGYERVYYKHIDPVLGDYKLKDITRLDIQKLLRELKKSGSGFATRNRVRIMLGDMLDKAIKNDLLIRNVAKGITVKRDKEKEPRYLTALEQEDFFEAAKGTFYYNLFVVAVESGLRPGELFSLALEHCDFEKKEIKVTRTLHYDNKPGDENTTSKQFFFGPPKTKSSERVVPMSKTCEEVLLNQAKQKVVIAARGVKKVAKEFEDLLFTTSFNTPICTQLSLDAINKILEEMNLIRSELEKFERFSMHSFRHTFASNCFRRGVKTKTLQKWLGHASVQMTEDLYTHLEDEFSHKEMERQQLQTNNSKVISISNLRGTAGVGVDTAGVLELLKGLVSQALEERKSL